MVSNSGSDDHDPLTTTYSTAPTFFNNGTTQMINNNPIHLNTMMSESVVFAHEKSAYFDMNGSGCFSVIPSNLIDLNHH